MEQHDVDTELAAARELLDSTSAGHLAYTAEDGTPRVVTVGFFWTGEQFVTSTAATAPKVAALSARPDVALAVDAGGRPEQARALSVRGRADIRIVEGVVEEYLAAARRSMDAEPAAQFAQNCRALYDRMARIAITPRWVRYYDFGAGRVPRFLQELAERSGR
ncbi:pyridoxamine 5'-phosphate oxidase family protein [Pseudonocardia lutea]|uniref:Pyridoxamine 5'-phosphate oxidase family protein n=1 Tax=Pseudonocardia lutea TaxID=2172015 RepID=A0ABW1IGB7_9PSEU